MIFAGCLFGVREAKTLDVRAHAATQTAGVKTVICALLVLVGLFLSPRSNGAAIVYTLSGFGSGTIGNEQFTDAAFTLELFANTNDVMTLQLPDGGGGFNTVHSVDEDSSRITIGGIGNALFAAPMRFFCNQSGTAGFGHGIDPKIDLLNVSDSALVGYDLRSAFGPIQSDAADHFFNNETTTRGGLTFSAMRDVTFTAVVPEPSVAVVLVATVAPGALRRRRSRRG